jgi:branched-chain amino acid aminotransferase
MIYHLKHRAGTKACRHMMLDWQGRVAECTGITSSSSGRQDPYADRELPRITRATAIRAPARHRGDRAHQPDELSNFSECFITGTAAEVTAVSEIAQWKFTPGSITQHLMADYTAEVQPKGKAAAA